MIQWRCGLAGAHVGQLFFFFGLFAHHTRDEFCGGGGVWVLGGHGKRASLGGGDEGGSKMFFGRDVMVSAWRTGHLVYPCTAILRSGATSADLVEGRVTHCTLCSRHDMFPASDVICTASGVIFRGDEVFSSTIDVCVDRQQYGNCRVSSQRDGRRQLGESPLWLAGDGPQHG